MNQPTMFGRPLSYVGVIHYPARFLEGLFVWPLPLCWDAELTQRTGERSDDALWWLSVDHGAIDPSLLVASTDRDAVSCPACLEWLHG